MTCKDCIHHDVCKRIDYELDYHNKSTKEAEEELPIKCDSFNDKERLIELPCEIGNTVYCIIECSCEDIDGAHTECEFYGFGTDDRICKIPNDVKCPYRYRVIGCNATEMNILIFAREWGKTAFPTREAAEKALKERKV